MGGAFQLILLQNGADLSSSLVAGSSVEVRVKATDTEGLSATSKVSIQIVQSNRKPVLQKAELTVAENSPPLSLIGFVSGYDPDGSALQFSIVSGKSEMDHIVES